MAHFPLLGQRIVVTRAREQAGELSARLRELGAETIEFPTIEIRPAADYAPLDAAIAQLPSYDWLIFTSANGVRFFLDRLDRSSSDLRCLRARLCAIGPATRRAIEQFHLKVDLTPAEYVAESLVAAFASEDLNGKRVLLPRAAMARDVAPAGLTRLGARVDVVEAYRTAIPDDAPARAREIFSAAPKPGWITFTSSSTVTNFLQAAGAGALAGVRIASIGPVTTSTLRRYALDPAVEAAEFTTAGLIDAIVRQAPSMSVAAPLAPPEDLIARIRGFQSSRALLTAIELDVFAAIGDGATAQETASRVAADPRALEMLLNAAAALGVLKKRGAVFHNTAESARWLCGESRLALMHTVRLWLRWSALTDCVRTGTPATRQLRDARDTRAFIAAMHQNAAAFAPLVVQAAAADNVRRMLDLGGGSGAYSIAFARAHPGLTAEILDLPEVKPLTLAYISQAGLTGRISVREGDLRTSGYGSGYDLVFISAICHMLSPEENVAMFRTSGQALAAGGRVVVQDFILENDKTQPAHAALFSLNMLVGTERGSSYSEEEYAAWLRDAGFESVRRVRLPGPAGLMIARRP